MPSGMLSDTPYNNSPTAADILHHPILIVASEVQGAIGNGPTSSHGKRALWASMAA